MSTNEKNQSVKLTKRIVDQTRPEPGKSQTFIRDNELPGFALRISPGGTKAFIIEKRIEGQVRRQTLGRYPTLTVEQARRQALKTLGQIEMGLNPIAERKTRQAKGITLSKAFEDFKLARKDLKPNTLKGYQQHMDNRFGDWLPLPLTKITKQMITRRHRDLGEKTPALANGAFRVLKAVLNFACHHYEDGHGQPVLNENPVNVLNHTRAWYPCKRRLGVIKAGRLADWYRAVQHLKGEDKPTSAWVIADYLCFVLLTGLRAREASELRWEDIDLEARTLTLHDPKNRQTFTLPLADITLDVLAARAELRMNDYVFPNKTGTGPLIDPRKQMAHVTEETGIEFVIHDLRRTFITVAESLDISGYTLKRLVNHKVSQDVTDGYIISDVERLRAPVQQVAEFFKVRMGLESPDNVVALTPKPSPAEYLK